MNVDPTTYLRRDNPRLLQLEQDYAALDLPWQHTAWKTFQYEGVHIDKFRGEGDYLAQMTLGATREQYVAMYEYVKRIDKYHYLDRLTEDGAFGCVTQTMPDGNVISRDLCDSIMEIYFIEDTLNLSHSPLFWTWKHILDIGAGYGRLAYRLSEVISGCTLCIDSIATSTFLCEFYFKYRDCDPYKTDVVLLTEIDEIDTIDQQINLACNIHSWSECSSGAINWWLDKLVAWNVPYLFLVPHDPGFVCIEPDGSIGNFRPLVEQHGYKLIAEQPIYKDGTKGLYSQVVYYMFGR